MKTFSRKFIKLACDDLGFSEEEFKRTLDELVHKGFLSTNAISKHGNYNLAGKALKSVGDCKSG